MRIFVTAHNSRVGGGISVAKSLLSSFEKVGPQHEYCITVPSGLGFETCQTGNRIRIIPFQHRGVLRRWCWETLVLPAVVRRFRPEVIFNMANRGFIHPPAPQATYVQDAHLFYPFNQFGRISQYSRLAFLYNRLHFKRSLRKTSVLFCQTDVARRRLVSAYDPKSKIVISPNRLPDLVKGKSKTKPLPPVLKPYEDKFKLLILSRYYFHKNLEIIPRVIEGLRSRLRDVVFILTIPPKQHASAIRFLRKVERGDSGKNVVNVGAVPEDELEAHYTAADALFLPSLLESFSGTYLEAMHFGLPIITSDRDFARIVCEDAALYVQPLDPGDIAEKILRLKNDQPLRRQLADAGRRRFLALSTSWDDTALKILNELEEINLTKDGDLPRQTKTRPASARLSNDDHG